MTADVRAADDAPAPLDVSGVIGMRGRMPGRLDYPRAADVSPDGSVVVIDKSGRVQRFRPDGTLTTAWRMPRTANGMPTGVTIDRHGRAWIADTHEHRVVCFSPTGETLWTLGGYGKDDGEFNKVKTAEIKTEVFRLPTVCFAEDDGTFTNSGRVIAWKEKAADPPGDGKSDREIMARLFLELKGLYEKEGGAYSEPIFKVTWNYAMRTAPSSAKT